MLMHEENDANFSSLPLIKCPSVAKMVRNRGRDDATQPPVFSQTFVNKRLKKTSRASLK